MAKINSKIDKALRKEVIENGVFLGHIASFGFNCNVYLYKNEVYREDFTINDDFIITDFARWTWYMVKSNITQFHPNEPYAEELIEYMTLYEHSLYLSNKKYRELAKIDFAELKKDYQESGLLDDINALLKKSKSKTFRYSKYESEKSTRKSLKEDSLDDIIPMGHSEYFDTLVEFFKHNDVPIRISHTAGGGKICYVENDMEFITVIFKSPKRGYELLKMLEMYGDGSTFLSRGKGGAWYSNHVPLEEVYVWDMDKDEFVNYKGKVLKNIDYDDIVESKKNVEKSFKESTDIFDTLENAWDRSTKNNNVFEKTVLKLKTDSFKDPFNKYSIIYMFADGSSIDCNSLDPFDCDWCTYVSEDLSFVHEFKK